MPEKIRVYIPGVSKIKEKGKIKPNPPENNKIKTYINQITKKTQTKQKQPNLNLPGLLSISRKKKWCPSCLEISPLSHAILQLQDELEEQLG